MAKKKKSDPNSASALNKQMIDAQKSITKMQINAQKDIQKMVNSANKASRTFNADEAVKTRAFNKEEAATAREWEKMMSDTSHQREVKDLKKAGLNPVLSATGGGGASSYTTSAATAQNASVSQESGAGAIGSLMSGLMSTIGALTSATMQANTQRYASDQAAAAQIRSAETSAAAQRYAADQAAAAQRYAADKQYQIAMEKPATSLFSLVDKYLGGSASEQAEVKKLIKETITDPAKLFVEQNSPITKDGFKLATKGVKIVDKVLNGLNVLTNNRSRSLWVKAFIFGDSKAASDFANYRNYSQNYYGKH